MFNPVTLHDRPMIFPSLCLGVRSLDFDLEAANTASTALAAARATRKVGEGAAMGGEGGRGRDHSISEGVYYFRVMPAAGYIYSYMHTHYYFITRGIQTLLADSYL